jgi:hypothetical protein
VLLSAALVSDLPYGIGAEAYDQQGPPTCKQVSDILAEFIFLNTGDFYVALFFVGEKEIGVVSEALTQKGFTPQPLFWYKVDLNTAGDPGRWTQAVECAVLGILSTSAGSRNVQMSHPRDPTCRHNIVHGPALHKLSKNYCADGVRVINQHEKPEYVVQAMLGPYIKPGDTVIVGGSGAGGEVRGLLALGVHVIGFENDETQWRALNALMTSWSPPPPSRLAFTRDAILAAQKYSRAYIAANEVSAAAAEGEEAEYKPVCTTCSALLSDVEFDFCTSKKCKKAVCLSCLKRTDDGKLLCKVCHAAQPISEEAHSAQLDAPGGAAS